jgi:hypothetical protein
VAVQLEIDMGLDTNPGYAAERGSGFSLLLDRPPPDKPYLPPPQENSSPVDALELSSSALALSGALHLTYQRSLTPRQQGSFELFLFEQDYLVDGDGQAKTEISASVGYNLFLRWLTLAAAYDYSLHLFGHEPQLSQHEVTLRGGFPMLSWLSFESSTGFQLCDVHDDSYGYLEGAELSESAALKAEWRILTFQIGYHLLRNWANAVEFVLPSSGANSNSSEAVFQTDYSAIAHGPRLGGELSLPWRLSLAVAASVLWYEFDSPDRFSQRPSGEVIWEKQRRDLKILVGAELRRPLAYGLEAAIYFNSVDNFSSLDDTTPVNRSYSRRLLNGVLRWSWSNP